MTPLQWAARRGKTDTVALLVKSGANVNMKDDVSTVCYSAAMIVLFVYFMHSYNIVGMCVSDVIIESVVVYFN